MWTTLLFVSTALAALINSVESLTCYRCHSTQPGCGKELNIRLQERYTCPGPHKDAGENFCVKVIEDRDGEQHLTRECLTTLLSHTEHRKKIPTVRRHGYCEPARNDDPYNREDQHVKYCFCNDWNGCNTAERSTKTSSAVMILSLTVVFVLKAMGAAGL